MVYRFEDFELDGQQLELRKGGKPRKLEPLTFSLLTYLVENHDRVVTKDDINKDVWDGRIVSEAALSSAIHAARTAVEDDGKSQRLIKTVHGKGFRFIGSPESDAPVADFSTETRLPPRHSIAVLKFNNMSGDPEQDYFSEGMCEDIITVLAKIPGLLVVARNSSFAYKDENPDLKKVGIDLGVRHVLEGSVRRIGDVIRVTGQLIDTTTGLHVWAERYDRPYQDVFSLQDEMTREIVSALQIPLASAEKGKLWSGGTQNYKAWENLIRARYMMFTNQREHIETARELVKASITLDPQYASALTWLAFSHWQDIINGWSEDFLATFMTAKNYAEQSIEIDAHNPDTLSVMAFLSLAMKNHNKAAELAEKALEIAPNDPTALGCLGFIDFYCDRLERSARLMQRGLFHTQDFFTAYFPTMEAGAYYLMKDYKRATSTIDKALSLDENYAFAYVIKAVICAESGQLESAKSAIIKACDIDPTMRISTMDPVMPFKNPETFERVLKALRTADMPE